MLKTLSSRPKWHALLNRLRHIRTPLDGPIALFLSMIPVSLWVTFDVQLTLFKVGGLLAGFLLFYATVAWVRTEKQFWRALALYLFLGTIVAMMGLTGTNWLYKNPWLSGIALALPQWIRGLPGAPQGFHPNELAGVLLWFVPLQMALIWCLARAGRLGTRVGIALCASAALTCLTLLLTQSRGAWLGLGIGLLVVGAWLDRRVRFMATVLLLAVVLVLALQGTSRLQNALREGIAPQLLGESNWSFRLGIWRAALWGIADFPITGMGLGTFRAARRMYPLSAMPADYDFGHAHNGFLQAALDLGLPGLFAYVAMWVLSIRMAVQVHWRGRGSLANIQDTALFWSGVGLLGCLVSSFVFHWTDAIALGAKGGLPWWMLLGLITSLFLHLRRGLWVEQDGA